MSYKSIHQNSYPFLLKLHSESLTPSLQKALKNLDLFYQSLKEIRREERGARDRLMTAVRCDHSQSRYRRTQKSGTTKKANSLVYLNCF